MAQRPDFGGARGPGPRLLLISYHYPPGSAIGALRWQKFTVLAAQRGWAVDAITAHPDEIGSGEPSRLAELPPDTRVFYVRTPTPVTARIESLLRRRARAGGAAAPAAAPAGPLQVPEPPGQLSRAVDTVRWYARDASWSDAAFALGRSLAAEGDYLACVTSGPPHMVHTAGHRLARRTGVRHVMDLRDPWSLIEQLAPSMDSPLWRWLARHYEGTCAPAADLVVMNTEVAARDMRARYPAAASRIIAVANGVDDVPVPKVARDGAFVVAHAGTIYLDRDPRQLLRVAAALIARLGLTPGQFRLAFMGIAGDFPLQQLAEETGIAPYVRARAPGSREAALAFMAEASVLATMYQGSRRIIQAKIYDYMLFDAWLLLILDRDSAAAALLAGKDVDIVPPDDAAIVAALARRYADHAAGRRGPRLADDPRFSRQAQARILFDAIQGRAGR